MMIGWYFLHTDKDCKHKNTYVEKDSGWLSKRMRMKGRKEVVMPLKTLHSWTESGKRFAIVVNVSGIHQLSIEGQIANTKDYTRNIKGELTRLAKEKHQLDKRIKDQAIALIALLV